MVDSLRNMLRDSKKSINMPVSKKTAEVSRYLMKSGRKLDEKKVWFWIFSWKIDFFFYSKPEIKKIN